jgi:hypothetical protein
MPKDTDFTMGIPLLIVVMIGAALAVSMFL